VTSVIGHRFPEDMLTSMMMHNRSANSNEQEASFPGPQLVGEGQHPNKMQGHWVLARAGKRVLRPGGLELTRQMLDALAMHLLEPRRVLRDEGFIGGMRIAFNMGTNPVLRQRILAFRRAVARLGSMYKEHINIEDSVIFPLAARLLTQAEKLAIAGEMASRRDIKLVNNL
jgi:hypothetical protein